MKVPKIEATASSMFTLAGYLILLTIAGAVVSLLLKLVIGLLALGVVITTVAGIVFVAAKKFTVR